MEVRELKRLRNKFARFADPIGILVLTLLFVLPALAFFNLTPQTNSEDKPVLGVEDKEGIGVVLVGGVHDFVKEETLTFPSETQYEYRATLIKRAADMYSKPVIQLVNYSSEKAIVSVSGSTQLPAGSEIAVIVNDQRYVIQDIEGISSATELTLPARSESIMYLQLDTKEDVEFNDQISLIIVQKD